MVSSQASNAAQQASTSNSPESETKPGPANSVKRIGYVQQQQRRRGNHPEGPVDGAGGRPTGLRRTGKSCRLRWVNYLHPGLKRGRITADEERLILTLHAQWGSRWSRIARKLPGRTDNEIKNYWRTHMRKMAQEEKTKKKATTPDPASSSSTSATACSASATATSSSAATTTTDAQQETASMDDDEAEEEATTSVSQEKKEVQPYCAAVEMDQLWNDIAATEIFPDMMMSWRGGHAVEPTPSSPVWEFCSDYPLWRIDDEEYYNTINQHARN